MSDTVSQSFVVNGQTIILYTTPSIAHYTYDQIFDPDNPSSGTYFPALYSTVIKADGSMWYVSDRNTATFASTLSPISIIATEESSEVSVISYSSDKFCIYIDKRTIPYKLAIDAKLLFYGNNLNDYVLTRDLSNGSSETISLYLDSTDTPSTTRIPMSSISDTHVYYKFPTNCHTYSELEEGEPLLLSVYNNLGNLAAEITVYVRNAYWWNDATDGTNPIVGLDATCLQMNGSDFYIYEKQDPSHLNIQPYITYADGTKINLTIDDNSCYLYGLEDYVPSYPGFSQSLIIKYFLNYNELAALKAAGSDVRFLTVTKNLVVRSDDNSYSVKVSVVPKYSYSSNSWYLRFFAYTNARDAVYDITDMVTIDEDYPFTGDYTKWGTEQHVEFKYDMQSIFETDTSMESTQAIWITVWDPSTYTRFTIRDSGTSGTVYGSDNSVTRRPIIHYDSSIDKYFIPTSVFGNWEAIVESFFYYACPPYDDRYETIAPVPTHFIVRDSASGAMIMSSPISSKAYGTAWSTIGTTKYSGQTLLVEFLCEVDGVNEILYGVPVDVTDSSSGYVG